MNFDFISTILSAVCSVYNHFSQNNIVGDLKVYFYQYDKRKLHACFTLKKINTSVKSLTKVLLINFKVRIIHSINKQ